MIQRISYLDVFFQSKIEASLEDDITHLDKFEDTVILFFEHKIGQGRVVVSVIPGFIPLTVFTISKKKSKK